MKQFNLHILSALLMFVLVLLTSSMCAQDASSFEVAFMKTEVEFKENEIVSNPLRIYNTSNRDAVLSLEMSAPPGWSLLRKGARSVKVAAGDSVFVPTRLIPKGKVEGNTKYSINAMLRSEDGLPMAVANYFCFTKAVVKWDMTAGPSEKLYFKNGQDEVDFDLTLKNEGNYQQDFQLSLNSGQRDDLLLLDTNGLIIRRPTYTLPLESDADTTMSFRVRPTTFKRNFRTVSLMSHLPYTKTQEKRFRYYAISEEAKDIDQSSLKRGTKLDFVRLSNERQVSPHGGDHLPLTMEAQFQNILSDFSILSLNFNGMKQLDEERRLVYFTQLFFSQNFYNRELLNNTPWYVGYFTDKWDIQVGNVSGRAIGLPSAGKGVTGSYKINDAHRVGGHFTMNPGLNAERIRSYGAFHEYTGDKNLRVTTSLTRSEDKVSGRDASVISSRASRRIAKGHNVSLLGALSYNTFSDTSLTRTGYLLGASYSGVMLDRKLRTNIASRYSSPTFGIGSSELLNVNHRAAYRFNDRWEAQMLNNYNHNTRYADLLGDSIYSSFKTFNNRLNFAARTDVGVFQPGLFYNITEQPLFTLHSRGLALNYSLFNFEQNTLFSTAIQAGYNNPLNLPEIKEYFTLQWTMLARIRTMSVNMRYNYGPTNPLLLTTALSSFAYPKQFRASMQHQHLFRNTRFLMQNSGTYTYNNQLISHNIGFNPELFYFSATGWRFSVNANLSYNSSDVQQATQEINQNLGLQRADNGPVQTLTMRMGVSLRKEIGVPIPLSKSHNYDIDIISYYDLDGDGEHDKDEPTLENVVVRMHKEEVLTNIDGEAGLKNMPQGDYRLDIIPLEAPEGWFPEVPDSVMVMNDMTLSIPFVRGIKVTGQVMMDLDQRTVSADERFDLTNVKITANNGQKSYMTLTDFEGNFDFYLPNGDYKITLDENILSSKYRLMQNDIPVTLSNDLESMFVTFFIVEKRRSVKVKKFE